MTRKTKKSPDPQDERWGKLMQAGQDGDKDALRELYSDISPIILAFCQKRAGYLGIPEDALQESLIAIHRNRQVYLPKRSFRAWMFAIVRSKLIDQIRKRARIQELERVTSEDVTNSQREAYTDIQGRISDSRSGDAHEHGDEQTAQLRAEIAELPPKYREAITLVKLEGYSVREAAQKAGVSESALKVRTHRGFKMLEERLKRVHEQLE